MPAVMLTADTSLTKPSFEALQLMALSGLETDSSGDISVPLQGSSPCERGNVRLQLKAIQI